jgi:hypothetical protein
MRTGYHRLSFRARHVLRQLGNARNIALQRLHLHELRHAISRKHGFRGPKHKPDLGAPGLYHRLSGRARHLIRRLRRSQQWSVQKQTVTELEREVGRGARAAEAREARRQRMAERAERMAKRTRERGRQFRQWAQRKQELALVRAERRQRGREAGTRRPPLSARARQRGRDALRGTRARVRSWRPRRAPQRSPQPRVAPVRTARAPAARTPGLRPVRARTASPGRTSRPAPVRTMPTRSR